MKNGNEIYILGVFKQYFNSDIWAATVTMVTGEATNVNNNKHNSSLIQ
jgi:hypothetical protein